MKEKAAMSMCCMWPDKWWRPRTAPKGKGVDIIEIAMVTDGDINILSEMMVKMVAEHGMKFFLRDAENILNAECVLLIGTH